MIILKNGALFLPQINSGARISSQALSEIESRHQDIICLESSIKELHEIFADTAMLLEIQVRWLHHEEIFSKESYKKEYTDVCLFLLGGVNQQHREECDECCRICRHIQSRNP